MPLTEGNLKILHDQSKGNYHWVYGIESWSEGYLSNGDDGEETSSSQQTTSDSRTLPSETTGSSESELVERNHMALVTVAQPGPVKHQSAASESQHLMSGRLIADCGGFLFIPSAPSETQWRMKGETPTVPFLRARTKEELEEARRFLKGE